MSPEEIASIRRRLGLSYQEFASVLHTSLASVYRWEKKSGRKKSAPVAPYFVACLKSFQRALALAGNPTTLAKLQRNVRVGVAELVMRGLE